MFHLLNALALGCRAEPNGWIGGMSLKFMGTQLNAHEHALKGVGSNRNFLDTPNQQGNLPKLELGDRSFMNSTESTCI